MLGENRLYVAIELHALVGSASRPGENKQRDAENFVASRVHSSVPEAVVRSRPMAYPVAAKFLRRTEYTNGIVLLRTNRLAVAARHERCL